MGTFRSPLGVRRWISFSRHLHCRQTERSRGKELEWRTRRLNYIASSTELQGTAYHLLCLLMLVMWVPIINELAYPQSSAGPTGWHICLEEKSKNWEMEKSLFWDLKWPRIAVIVAAWSFYSLRGQGKQTHTINIIFHAHHIYNLL